MSVYILKQVVLMLVLIILKICWIHADCGMRDYGKTRQDADGASLPDRTKRLVGAQLAVNGEFPWQVRLRSFQLTYSGVMLRNNWVLTAASCFYDNSNPSRWNVLLNDISSSDVDPGEKEVYVESIFVYGGYNRTDHQNNIALVKLNTTGISDVQPACIANGKEDLTSDCVLTGYGSPGQGEEYVSTLRKLKVQLLSPEDCVEQRVASSVGVDKLCAVHEGSGNDASSKLGPCTGDRGSPVLCQTGERWSVVGVVSDEYACQSSRTAPLIENVAHFSAWINKIISMF